MIGLDIGSHSVKLVAAHRRGSGVQVDTVARAPLPPGALHGAIVRDVAAVADVVRRLARIAGPRARRAVVALPASAVVMRRLAVPAAAGAALDATVAREAAALVPDALHQAVVDYHRLGDTADARVRVLVVAARRDVVRSHTGVVRAAGLEPHLVDVDVLALARVAEAGAAVVHVGARRAVVAVLSDDGPVYAGDVPADGAGGAALADGVARALALAFPDSPHVWERALLSGGGASLPGLAPALAGRLGCPVRAVDPFAGLRLGPRVDRPQLAPAGSAFALAVGLARRGLAA